MFLARRRFSAAAASALTSALTMASASAAASELPALFIS